MVQKECIFCGNQGKMSKEHLWPNWLNNLSEKDENAKYQEGAAYGIANNESNQFKMNVRSGDVMTKKYRVVCRTCNSGWMSSIEESVKPILLGAFGDCDKFLTNKELKELSTWLVMKNMVAEQTDNESVVTSKEECHLFESNRVFPKYYKVYAARHSLDTTALYSRETAFLKTHPDAPNEIDGLRRNTQVTTLVVGKVVFFIICCKEPSFNVCHDFKLNRLTRFYPERPKKTGKKLKHLKMLSDQQFVSVAKALSLYIESGKVEIVRKCT
ncbi:hypothetical protein [Vibrio cholerae]|uniref:hypothetical protein n=1 Tax=Vibrio cholerae TaxID=666 RepID=UPI000E0A074C|nr:hypothetical protein [Vibrio cholerae]